MRVDESWSHVILVSCTRCFPNTVIYFIEVETYTSHMNATSKIYENNIRDRILPLDLTLSVTIRL